VRRRLTPNGSAFVIGDGVSTLFRQVPTPKTPGVDRVIHECSSRLTREIRESEDPGVVDPSDRRVGVEAVHGPSAQRRSPSSSSNRVEVNCVARRLFTV
jgi:hypothetical protein